MASLDFKVRFRLGRGFPFAGTGPVITNIMTAESLSDSGGKNSDTFSPGFSPPQDHPSVTRVIAVCLGSFFTDLNHGSASSE